MPFSSKARWNANDKKPRANRDEKEARTSHDRRNSADRARRARRKTAQSDNIAHDDDRHNQYQELRRQARLEESLLGEYRLLFA
jgi:hypothetical protein